MKRLYILLIAVFALSVIVAGVAAANTISGTPRGDVLTGTKYNDQINGGKGNDSLYGKAGFDTLNCGEGIYRKPGKADSDFADGGYETKKQRQAHPGRADVFHDCETHVH